MTPDLQMTAEPLRTLRAELHDLKAARRAVLVAHNYQADEVQAEADFTGDSLELARWASRTEATVIVFAGVRFMAESAKILSPEKTVLLPVADAGCPLADTITADDVRRAKAEHPRAAVVAYVNTSAEVKAEADCCCTSANAVQIVNALPHDEILFVPDKNLADWVARHTHKRILPWSGSCCTHHRLTAADVSAALAAHPGAKFIAHPECRPEVCNRADAVLSTAGMVRYARGETAKEFVVGTETGMLYRLRQENPDKRFHAAAEHMVCRTMKLTSLADVVGALRHLRHIQDVAEPVRQRAAQALKTMFRLV
jgi:quinolinate synthase